MHTYILLIKVNDSIIKVGSLGYVRFDEGYYIYVGSARKGLYARLSRHLRKDKKLFWHIDYLTYHYKPMLIGLSNIDECKLARMIASNANAIDGFGASDCSCYSHLFHLKQLYECIAMLKRLCIDMRGVGFEPTNP